MTRTDFLAALERLLSKLPEARRADVLADYEEHFRIGAAKGKSDDEIARSLGTPRQIAAACLAEEAVSRVSQAEGTGARMRSLVRAMVALVGLGFFNAVFVAGPFFGLVGVLIGLWAAALSPALAGLAVVAEAARELQGALVSTLYGWGHVFLGLGLVALAGLLALGMIVATRWFAMVTARYVKLNFEIIAK